MKWDGIPHHTNLGNRPPFLISCLSARTAREYQTVQNPTQLLTPTVVKAAASATALQKLASFREVVECESEAVAYAPADLSKSNLFARSRTLSPPRTDSFFVSSVVTIPFHWKHGRTFLWI